MRKRMLALCLTIAMVLSMAPVTFASGAILAVSDFQLTTKLETVAEVVLYGGDTESVTYENQPTAGLQYLLVEASVDVTMGTTVDMDAIQVVTAGGTYSRIQEDSFLEHHEISPMRHGETALGASGTLVFSVPSSLTEGDLLEGGTLVLEDGTSASMVCGTAQETNLIVQHSYESYVERQAALEATYLATAKAGEFTPEQPYIIVNPYEIAPLAALVIFETAEPAQITTSIVGKLPETTITNTVEGYNTYHEIPLIGLYEGANTVELTVTTQSGTATTYTHSIQTVTKSALPTTTLVTQDLTQLSDGLYMLKDVYRTLIDVNGDIRGYFAIYTGGSVLDEVDENGHIWVSSGAYSLFGTIYEFDYTGYLYRELRLDSIHTHHDGYLLGDELLLINGAINLEDNTYAIYDRPWEYIFNSTQGSFEVRDNGSSDWLHLNTIADGGEGYILVSMRNQNAVAKLSYPDLEVQWVLSDNQLACPGDQDKYLTPVGEDFQWFYSQHDVSLVSENDDGSMDITIFDNGMQRGLDPDADYPTEELYSRMVVYRIDETAQTVEQIWEYGQELGTDGLSYVHGSTQYIPESDTYLGNFDTFSNIDTSGLVLLRDKMQVIEVNQAGETVFAVNLDESCYRAEKLSLDTLYSPWQGLGTNQGVYNYLSNGGAKAVDMTYAETPATAQIFDLSANEDFLFISGFVTGEVSQSVTDRTLVLEHTATGEKLGYTLENNASMVQKASVSAELQGVLDSTAGFYHSHLNLQDLVDGTYTVTLVATQNGTHYATTTDYILQIGQDVVVVETTGLVEQHNDRSAELQSIIQNGNYTLDNPLTVLNPYDASPLSALIAFDTDQLGTVSVTIQGKDEPSTVNHDFTTVTESHTLPIYGLYANQNNVVTITFTATDGTVTEKTVYIQTQPLPDTMPMAEVTVANTELMAEGFTYAIMEGGGSYCFDHNGDVRWYTTISISTMPIKRLANGNLLSGSNTAVEEESTAASLFEFDMLGRVHNEYLIYGAHHEALELSNGDLLVAASAGDTVEDYIVRLDRTTGEIVDDWDMKDILSDMECLSDPDWQLHIYNNQTVNNPNATEDAKWATVLKRSANDWFHNNALYYDEAENTILASGRMKDAVVKFDADTGEVIWILADPSADWAEAYADKLLTPVGEDFEYFYGNHAITVADNGDILLFDNGNYRTKEFDLSFDPNDTYSCGVRYAIDEEAMTAEQVWQYGKELGSSAFSSYISDIDYLDTDHYLINFGGILTDGATGEAFSSTAMQKQEHVIDPQGITLIVEIKDDVVVNEMHISASDGTACTYRIERLTPYFAGEGYLDLTWQAKRLGTLESTETVAVTSGMVYTNDMDYSLNDVLDSGEDVYVDITAEDAYNLVLDNGVNQYIYSTNSVVKSGLPNGDYVLGMAATDGSNRYQSLYRQITVGIQPYDDFYEDVNRDNWFFEEVMSATYAGLFNGTDPGIFSPYETMTVSMVETVLSRLSGGTYALPDSLLTTISAEKEDSVSRQQLATILYDYGQATGMDMTQNTNILSYNDAFFIAEYGFEPMQWVCEKGIIYGTDENDLKPEALANRSEVAAMMMRLRALTN